MLREDFSVGDTVVMKKPHPCGENRWRILRSGADVKLSCLGCGRVIMLDRMDFLSSAKGLLHEKNREIDSP